LYGVWNVATALFVGHIAHTFNLTVVVICGVLFDSVSWTVNLVWQTDPSSKYLVYLLGSMIGVSDGVWQTTTMGEYLVFETMAFSWLAPCSLLSAKLNANAVGQSVEKTFH